MIEQTVIVLLLRQQTAHTLALALQMGMRLCPACPKQNKMLADSSLGYSALRQENYNFLSGLVVHLCPAL